MIISNPVVRFVLKVMSVCGLAADQRDSLTVQCNHGERKDSPFVLVSCSCDGRWDVFQQNYDTPLASFDEMQEACDFANQLARARSDAMVLIGRRRYTSGHSDTAIAQW